ncbi:MAG: Lrp/AsnC family transcriptional regulator [Chitinophagaceae bacterium]|nr:Lrp/AsnC family transcriptional regulator [Chitinophagaceae bacterium]
MKSKTVQTEKNTETVYKIDEKDKAILNILQQNAKATVTEIAQKIHLSTSPTFDRIKRLEVNGIIKQYVTLVDHSKVNRGLMVICYVSLKEHNKNAGTKFIQSILAMPEVLECYSISGEFDFMLKVVGENMERYYDFHVNKLSQAENVGHIQSVFVMGKIKESLVQV